MSVHLGQLLSQRAVLSPSREALVTPAGRWTFRQFDQRVGRLASYLAAQGVNAGERIAVLARNGEILSSALFAAGRLGATLVVLNWRLKAEELEYILSDSTPTALIYEEEFGQTVGRLLAARPRLLLIGSEPDGPGAHHESIVGAAHGYPPVIGNPAFEHPAVIMYTSGTTGHPKGAMISHKAMIAGSQANSCTLDWRRDHRFLLIAPMFHIGGLSPLVTNVLKGCTTILLPDFDPLQAWKTIAQERVTSLMTVPVMLQALLTVARKTQVDSSSLQWVTCGASAVPAPLIEAGMAAGIEVQQVYGATEFGGAISFWTAEMGLDKAGSQGKALLGGEVKVVDIETHGSLAPGQKGEIWCRGPMMFDGYWRNPGATNSALIDGWYRTGDVGYLDEDGFIYVVDRCKDMIISGGENVYPAELEAVIQALPGIAEVAVVGRPDERWGEVPIAFVVVEAGAEITADAVMQICREKLAGFKCVKDVRFIQALPRSAVGKVLKRALLQQ
ncbi:Long-chain-fatty-acid--CoA ligase FadD13 [compost metagenome]